MSMLAPCFFTGNVENQKIPFGFKRNVFGKLAGCQIPAHVANKFETMQGNITNTKAHRWRF